MSALQFVGLAKPTMKPLLNSLSRLLSGEPLRSVQGVAFYYGVIVIVFLRILRGFFVRKSHV